MIAAINAPHVVHNRVSDNDYSWICGPGVFDLDGLITSVTNGMSTMPINKLFLAESQRAMGNEFSATSSTRRKIGCLICNQQPSNTRARQSTQSPSDQCRNSQAADITTPTGCNLG